MGSVNSNFFVECQERKENQETKSAGNIHPWNLQSNSCLGCYPKKRKKKNIREIIKSSIYHLEKYPTWPRSQHKHYLHRESDKDTFQLRAKQVPDALEDKSIEIITFNHIRQTGNSILYTTQQMTDLYTKSQATVRP